MWLFLYYLVKLNFLKRNFMVFGNAFGRFYISSFFKRHQYIKRKLLLLFFNYVKIFFEKEFLTIKIIYLNSFKKKI
jgi:hypothetical protein